MGQRHRFETIAVHGGQESADASTLSRGVPIYRTSSYVFKSTEHGANLFALKELGNIYSRLTNPTNAILEERVTQLEGGAASVAVGSGTAAVFYSIITLAQVGDEIVSANNLYGGTYTRFEAILPALGIKTVFVDPKNPENFAAAITPKTKALYVETIGNPVLDVVDIEAIAAIAHRNGLPLIVDATFTTPPSVPSDRARSRHRGQFLDEVAWRAWDRDWRHHHRRRQVQLERGENIRC